MFEIPALRRGLLFAAAAFLVVPALIACAGDDDAADGDSEYNAYVKAVCSAYAGAVADATEKSNTDPAILTDPAKLSEGLTPIISEYADALADADAPAAYRPYAEQLEAQAETILGQLEARQVTSLAGVANLATRAEVPSEILDRVRTAASAAPECRTIGLEFFGRRPA